MLEPLRLRVIEALQNETGVTLSTNGPGGIQAGFFPCEADGLTLYLLVPEPSDVVFNLETDPAVVLTTPRWQAEGEADVRPLCQAPAALELPNSPLAAGCVLVAVTCRRVHFQWSDGWGYRETIDL